MKKAKAEEGQKENILPKVDPYFSENDRSTSNSGPSSITRNILQDKEGNFWLATWEGLYHYDGSTFTNFTNKEGLRRHRFFSLIEDSKGILWFGTIGAGVYRFDGKSFTNYSMGEGLVNDDVGCIYEDGNGDIWFGTRVGLSRFNGTSFENFMLDGDPNNSDVNSIIEDDHGNLWLGTRGEISKYDGKSFSHFNKEDGTPFINVRTIAKDKKGNIWLAGNDGLWRYNPGLMPISNGAYTNFTKTFVGYVYEDKAGNIWTSSEDPENRHKWVLSRYDEVGLENNSYGIKITATEIYKEENMFFGIMEDQKGGIWFGHLNGVCRFDPSMSTENDVINAASFDCFKEE